MKPGKILIVLLALLFIAEANSLAVPNGDEALQKVSITLLTSPEMLNMTNLWVEDYTGSNPDADIQILPMPVGDSKALMSSPGTIGMVTKAELSDIRTGQSHILAIGKDVIVPVMNAKHPYREEILHEGISPEAFSLAFTSSGEVTWESLLDNGSQARVNTIISGEGAVSGYLADFLKIETGQIQCEVVNRIDEMIESIHSDHFAIGFCRLTDVIDANGQIMKSGLELVPIDLNGNATIDKFENIYATPSNLQRGIWIGKYPKTLYSKLYAVTNSHSLDQGEISFLNWVVSDGQGMLADNGYSAITQSERYSNEEKLTGNYHVVLDVPVKGSVDKINFIVLGVLLAMLSVVFITRIVVRRNESEAGSEGLRHQPIDQSSGQVPAGLFFDKSHTWAFMEKDGKVRVGIDDFLQNVTGPITRVVMKQPGEKVKKGETLVRLVSRGRQLEIKSPLTGTVAEQNKELLRDSSNINSSPYEKGWICSVEPADWMKDLKGFLRRDGYTGWIKTELVRLKDFFSTGLSALGKEIAVPLMQDGGEICNGVLEELEPKVWEEFQDRFMNA